MWVAPLAKALIAANPQRIVWGTDWPHPDSSQVAGRKPGDLASLLPIDDGCVFNQLALGSGGRAAQDHPGGQSREALQILTSNLISDFRLLTS
jgi:hypothetical protein